MVYFIHHNIKKKSRHFMTINFRIFLLNYFQLNLKYKKPIFVTKIPKKTPEYSGVFSKICEENIGFSYFRFS